MSSVGVGYVPPNPYEDGARFKEFHSIPDLGGEGEVADIKIKPAGEVEVSQWRRRRLVRLDVGVGEGAMARNRGAATGGGWGRVAQRGQAEEMCPARQRRQHLVGFLQTATLCSGERQSKQSPSTMAK
jgi:hypothetical protein